MEETQVGSFLVASVLDTRVDVRTGGDLRAALSRRVVEGHRRILLDLSNVAFVDSTGLGAMIAILKQVGRDGEVALCGARDTVLTLLKLTRLDTVFRVFATRETALLALTGVTS